MVIIALPQSTIHLLGSSQTLTTTTSLLKELIDNALDAKATSVEVLLSQNTLDKIQVRDNGHGIQQKDLDALGRRGHTSKLSSFEELRSIGGITLGFRGEALASTVQLGDVSVTTRTDGEAVATIVVLKTSGGIARQSKTSHPVGTTICVTNFMSKFPVRKQTALKSVSKTLAKTKELLQTYALARPSIRFTLKVTKEAKGSWSFAPRPNDGVKEAVSQVVGKEASLQCMSKPLTFSEPGKSGDNQFEIDVILPRPGAEISKIGRGQYISIDSRPVSSEKGTMKKIVSLYKSYLRAAFGETIEIKNPFIRLDMKCPIASYDPNIEPAKDDILFGNEPLLLDSFESFFKEAYGDQKAHVVTLKPSSKDKVDNFELLLARQPDEPSQLVQSSRSPNADANPDPQSSVPVALKSSRSLHAEQTQAATILHNPQEDLFHESWKTRRSWGVDVSRDSVGTVTGPEINTHRNSPPGSAYHSSRQTDDDYPSSINPWSIAKMTAPLHSSAKAVRTGPMDSNALSHKNDFPSRISTPFQLPVQMVVNSSSARPNESPACARPRRRYSNEVTLIPNSILPHLSHHLGARGRRHSNGAINQDSNIYLEQTAAALANGGNGMDDVLGSTILSAEPAAAAIGDDLFMPDEEVFSRVQRQNDFISAKHFNETLPMTPPATQRRNALRKSNGLNRPLTAPRRITDNTEFSDGLQQTTLAAVQRKNDGLQGPWHRDSRSELDWAMEYEQNKEEASHKRRQELRAIRKQGREVDIVPENRSQSSPHKHRYNAALAALEADQLASQNDRIQKAAPETSMPHTDPRLYLMRTQALAALGTAPSKLTRAKSVKLPLERVPEQSKTHMLLVDVSTDTGKINKLAQIMASHDSYIAIGAYSSGLELSISAKEELNRNIQDTAEAWLDKNGERKYEVEYTFENLNNIKA